MLALIFLVICLVGPIGQWHSYAQTPAPQNSSANPSSTATQQAHDGVGGQQILRTGANLVLVRVIVRDAAGNAVANLHADDFRLFDESYDKNNQQAITSFAVESSGGMPSTKPAEMANGTAAPPAPAPSSSAPAAPQRYLAFFFDDVHLESDELGRARKAAQQYIAQSQQPGDRFAVFDSSGKGMLNFTDDRKKLHDALQALRSRPSPILGGGSCPPFDDYQAGLVVNNQSDVADTAAAEVLHCYFNDDPNLMMQAKLYVTGHADSIVNASQKMDESSLRALDELVRNMAGLTRPRNIVLVSPGFLAGGLDNEVSGLIDTALRAGVIISALDASGLRTAASLTDNSDNLAASQAETSLRQAGAQARAYVMSDLATGTGGTFFKNNNDLNRGFRLTSALPETAYVLGFTPSSRQLDGRFHTVKVTFAVPGKFTIQARRGYFAGNGSANPSQQPSKQ
jgi:VWFA-related protein